LITIQEIESVIQKLSKADLSEFRAWFEEYDARIWDKQFEEDASSGKLDKLANQAISDFNAGKYKEI